MSKKSDKKSDRKIHVESILLATAIVKLIIEIIELMQSIIE